MKKSTRIISVLMAMMLCFGTLSIGVSAQYAAYDQPAGYDSLEHPYVSIYQCGSMVLDYIDKILAEENISGEIDAVLWSPVRYDITSVDNTFDSLIRIMGSGLVKDAKGVLDLGDLERININAARTAPRRSTSGRTDLEMIYALTQFIKDNVNIIGRVVDGCYDNGGWLVEYFLDVNETVGDVHLMIKETAWNAFFEDDPTSTTTTTASSLDDMIDQFVYNLVLGEFGFLPSLKTILVQEGIMADETMASFHLRNISFYQLIKFAIRAALDKYVEPMLVEVLADADEMVVSGVSGLLGIPSGTSVEDMVSGLLDLENGYLTTYIRIDDTGIYLQPGFTNLLTSLLQTAKGLVSSLNLYPNVEFKTEEELAAIESESELVAYLARTVLVGLIDYADIPDTVTTIREVATYFLINLMADKLPAKDYLGMIERGELNPKTDGALFILADLAYYYLNATTTMNIPPNLSFDDTIGWAFDWVITKWGGLFHSDDLASYSVWEKIDKLLWQYVFQLDWLGSDFQSLSLGNQTKTLLFDKLIYAILDWNFEALMSIFRTNSTGELAQPITQIVLNLITRVINGLFEGHDVLPTVNGDPSTSRFTSLEGIVTDVSGPSDSNKSALRQIAENLINWLCVYDEAIITSVLPFVASSLAEVDDSAYEVQPPAGTTFTDDALELMLASHRPGNPDPTIRYDDPAYNFFGSEDFAPLYKYYNYKEIRNEATDLLEQYRLGNPEVTDYDITVITYRLDYYYNRLTLASANSTQLKSEIDKAVAYYGHGDYGVAGGTKAFSNEYTLRTWTQYMEALNYAYSVYETNLINYNNTQRQSQISFAREFLVTAIKQLKRFTTVADYSALDTFISRAQTIIAQAATNTSLYQMDTVADLNTALSAAIAVDRGYDGEDQLIIDDAALLLSAALDNITYVSQLAKTSTSDTILDKSNYYIWGVKENMKNAMAYISYVCVLGTGIMNTTPTANGFGTGTTITLSDENGVIESYDVIIFGDVDGDSKADGADANIIYAANAELLDVNSLSRVQKIAADADNNGVIDSSDAEYLRLTGLKRQSIAQNRVVQDVPA